MEVKELPKTDTEELTESQKNDLFTNIVRGKDVTEKIETSRGTFEVKFPRMKDVETIGRLTAARLNGLPATSFDLSTYSLIQQIATLDVIVLNGPAWYENAKKENNFTWGDVPILEYIQEVYAKAYDFRSKVQKMLIGDKGEGNSGMVTGKDISTADQPGLFDGLSGKS